jgi:hypothetical protein
MEHWRTALCVTTKIKYPLSLKLVKAQLKKRIILIGHASSVFHRKIYYKNVGMLLSLDVKILNAVQTSKVFITKKDA